MAPFRRERQGLLVRALTPTTDWSALYVAYSAAGYVFGSGFDFDAPHLDGHRAAWADAVVWDYVDDPAPSTPEFTARVLRFTGTGRLWMNSRRLPVPVVEGDTITGNLWGLVSSAPATDLVMGVRFTFQDGSTQDAQLDRIPAGLLPLNTWGPDGGTYPSHQATPQVVPAGATHAGIWVDGSAGWHLSAMNGVVALESSSAKGNDHLTSITIRRGRNAGQGLPAPATASVELVVTGAMPVGAGDPVEVQMGTYELFDLEADQLAASIRFAGIVGEPELTVNRASSSSLLSFIATSDTARLGTVRIGEEPWPQETAGQRAQRVLDAAWAAGDYFDLGTVDQAGYLVRARDVDAQPPLRLLGELAESSGGQLLESRAGVLSWRDRAPADVVAVTLEADHYAAPLVLPQVTAANQVTVEYGDPDANPRPELTVQDDVQVGLRGPVPDRLETQLATAADATARGLDLLGAAAQPAYRLEAITVDALGLVRRWRDDGDTDALAAVRQLLLMEPGDVIQLNGLPPIVPALAGAGRFVVEGWTETIGASTWRFQLNLTDLALMAPPATFLDVPPDLLVADVPEHVTYATATTWRPA